MEYRRSLSSWWRHCLYRLWQIKGRRAAISECNEYLTTLRSAFREMPSAAKPSPFEAASGSFTGSLASVSGALLTWRSQISSTRWRLIKTSGSPSIAIGRWARKTGSRSENRAEVSVDCGQHRYWESYATGRNRLSGVTLNTFISIRCKILAMNDESSQMVLAVFQFSALR